MLDTYCNQTQSECDVCLYYREDECKAPQDIEGKDLTELITEV